jgi:lipopolysaccharide biosynthesis glycosyltransferase
MTDEAVHIVVATDDAFALPTAVTLRSLVVSDPETPYNVHVLHGGLAAATQDRIARSLPPGPSTLSWLKVDESDLESLPTAHLSVAAYYRLLIPDLLPDADRVLYVDSDVLFRGSVASLRFVDLGTNLAAAVRSVNFPSICTWGAMDDWRELGLSPRAPFFNSGVLLIDVPAWRREAIGARVVEFVQSEHAHSANFDQQALNVVLTERWLELDPVWNLQTPLLDDRRGGHLLYSDEQIEQGRHDPVVVHFIDRPKPWHRDCTHPFRDEWRIMAGDTAFAPIELQTTSVLDTARWRIKRAASALVRGS